MSQPRSRHAGRSRHRTRSVAVQGPLLPATMDRRSQFAQTVTSTAGFMMRTLAAELDGVTIAVTDHPFEGASAQWLIDRDHNRIVLFRIPIERNMGSRISSAHIRKHYIEYCMGRAVAEYLGDDPDSHPEFPWGTIS